tara:strand:+ start:647 stop:1381 length:735 start_codon:yes stop_codon:yes gene_type:complete
MDPEKVRKTIGVLGSIRDVLPETIQTIQALMMQNDSMHSVLLAENAKLKLTLKQEMEAKQKLRESEKAREKQLKDTLKGREGEKEELLAVSDKLNLAQREIARIEKDKEAAALETAEARAITKVQEEKLNAYEDDNAKLKRELSQAKQVIEDVKKNAANRQALMLTQEKELAAETDSAQSGKRKDDAELQVLKMQVQELKGTIQTLKNILASDKEIGPEVRAQMNSAISTSARTADGVTNKIKF